MSIFHVTAFFSNPGPTVLALKVKIEAENLDEAHDKANALFLESVLVDDVGGLEQEISCDRDLWVSAQEIKFKA